MPTRPPPLPRPPLPENAMRRRRASQILGVQDGQLRRAIARGDLEPVYVAGWPVLITRASVYALAVKRGRPVPDDPAGQPS
jgi:hypothetical protein